MHCTCLLLTQSGHPTGTAHRHKSQFPFGKTVPIAGPNGTRRRSYSRNKCEGLWDVAILSGVKSLELAIQIMCSGDDLMRIRWLFVFLMTFGIVCAASAQVADIAGVLPGDRWVYEVTDEVSGELKLTTTVFVLDVSEQEINTRVSTREGARQIVYDRNWYRIDDSVWKYDRLTAPALKSLSRLARRGVLRARPHTFRTARH